MWHASLYVEAFRLEIYLWVDQVFDHKQGVKTLDRFNACYSFSM